MPSSVTRTTIYLVAALIATLPDTIVLFGVTIARNLHQVDGHTRILVQCGKGQSYDRCRTSRTDTVFQPSKAVFAARPSRQGEIPGSRDVRCLCYVCTIHVIVEPLSGVHSIPRLAVQVLDAKPVCGIDG